MTSLPNLIERLERAEGPSRELDEAIYELMGGCNHKRTKYYAVQSDTGFTCLDCGKDTYGAKSAPRYTASIDAALTLVPEGFRFILDKRPGADEGRCDGYRADVWCAPRVEYQNAQSWAATPALALAAAALRAQEVERG